MIFKKTPELVESVDVDRARNETLDCRVYALAALKIMQSNLKRVSERVSIEINEPQVKKQVDQKNTVIKRKRVFGDKHKL